MTRTISEQIRQNKVDAQWTVELHQGDPDDIQWNVDWEWRPPKAVVVYGMWQGVYRVTRNDIPDWVAYLTVAVRGTGKQTDLFTGQQRFVAARVLLRRVVIERTETRNPGRNLETTSLPISQLLEMCARAGAAAGMYVPPDHKHNPHKRKWAVVWIGDDTPDDDTIRRITGGSKKRVKYDTRQECHQAVLDAVQEWEQLPKGSQKKHTYVAHRVGRDPTNIYRDIRKAKKWQENQTKGKKK